MLIWWTAWAWAGACWAFPCSAWGASRNLLAERIPIHAEGVAGSYRLTDGVATWLGGAWETSLAVRFADTSHHVTFDLGQSQRLGALYLQADHNDRYRVSVSNDGATFESIWVAEATNEAFGMQPRFQNGFRRSARYLRLEPLSGDGVFVVDEFQAFSDAAAAQPLVTRRPGVSLEVGVRTKLLFVCASVGLFLWLTFAGASVWWVLGCALLPAWALTECVLAMDLAWPLEARQISLVRAVAATIAAVAVLRELFSPKGYLPHRATLLASLGLAGAVSVLAFYNLGRPQFWDRAQAKPIAIHVLDLRQYYGTAKYFDELGYRGLYRADVAAYVEDSPGVTLESLASSPMRNLTTHRMSTVGAERKAIEAVKDRFSAERWQQYKRDAAYVRNVMGDGDFLHYMRDFGGNATPVWISLAHALFSAFQANTQAFQLTALFDPLLLLFAFAAIGRTFGVRTAALVMVVFGANDFVMYGTNWAGSTLRHDWLVWLALGACALRRGWPRTGGVCLGLATLIRAFPGLAIVGASLPAVWWWFDRWRSEGRMPRWRELNAAHAPTLQMLVGAAGCTSVLLAWTSWRWGWGAWEDWLEKVRVLSADPHGNAIALKGLLGGWESGVNATLRQRWPLYAACLGFNLGAATILSRRLRPEQSAMLWLGLVAVIFYPANYYLHVVCLLPLVVDAPQAAMSTNQQPSAEPHAAFDPQCTPAQQHMGQLAGGVWVVLLGLCAAQYWTVLVAPLPLRFHLSTVLWFGAWTGVLLLLLRLQVVAGELAPFQWLRRRVPERLRQSALPGE